MVKLAALIILAASSVLHADTQTPSSFSGDFVIKVNYRYLLSKPEGYADSKDKKWPLVVFLHELRRRRTLRTSVPTLTLLL